MEHLRQLLKDLECISFQDISEIPEDKQHEVADQIERLQHDLQELNITNEKKALKPKTGDVFVSSKPAGMKFFIEDVGDSDDTYYSVSLIDYVNKDNPYAAGDLLSPEEWVNTVKTYGLVLEV